MTDMLLNIHNGLINILKMRKNLVYRDYLSSLRVKTNEKKMKKVYVRNDFILPEQYCINIRKHYSTM